MIPKAIPTSGFPNCACAGCKGFDRKAKRLPAPLGDPPPELGKGLPGIATSGRVVGRMGRQRRRPAPKAAAKP